MFEQPGSYAGEGKMRGERLIPTDVGSSPRWSWCIFNGPKISKRPMQDESSNIWNCFTVMNKYREMLWKNTQYWIFVYIFGDKWTINTGFNHGNNTSFLEISVFKFKLKPVVHSQSLAVFGALLWLEDCNTSNTVQEKCFVILEVLPPLHKIALLQVLHFAALLSLIVKLSRTFDRLLPSAMVQDVNRTVSSHMTYCVRNDVKLDP